MRHQFRTNLAVGLLGLLAVLLGVTLALADAEPPGDVRDRLTVEEMTAEGPNLDGPIHNDYFIPGERVGTGAP